MYENWKREHFKAGKMPFGIVVEHARTLIDKFSKPLLAANFIMPDGSQRLRDKAISIDEYHEAENNSYTPEQMACRKFGSEIVKDFSLTLNIDSIKEQIFGKVSDYDSFKGIEETVAAFNVFAGQLCESFSSVCGAFADAYFESIGAAAGAGHGGGGQDSGRWDGKNDDDEKRKPFILGHIPARKSGRGGNHR